VLALSGRLLASAPNPENKSTIETIPTVSLSPSNPQAAVTLKSFGSHDSFLMVDKSNQDMIDSPMNDRGVFLDADHKSVESSGNPADSSGVPTPRAGWVSFFGLLAVITARRFRHARRRAPRTA